MEQKLCHKIAAELNEKNGGPQTFHRCKHYSIIFSTQFFLYPVGMKHTDVELEWLLSHLSENAQI